MKLRIFRRLKKFYGISQIKKNGFWFVDIPRTSSTSIKAAIKNKYGITYAKRGKLYKHGGIFHDHQTSNQMINLLGRNVWDKLFTFTVIRNPWDRAYSFYQYGIKNYPGQNLITFKEHLLSINEIYTQNKFANHKVIRGCYDFLTYEDELVVNKIIRFENREEELVEISNKLGIENLTSLHLNKTLSQKSYKEFYDNESRRIIEDIYNKDIEEFGYSFD